MDEFLLTRQSIYDRKLKVVGYELLFRDTKKTSEGDSAPPETDAKNSEMILQAFQEIGIEALVGKKRAFVRFPPRLLTQADFSQLPPETIALKITGDCIEDKAIQSTLKSIHKKGYKLIIDEAALKTKNPLLEIADIIQVETRNRDDATISQLAKILQAYPAKLYAANVETHQVYKLCVDLGMDLFHGDFLSKPNLVKGKKVTTNRLVTLRLLSTLQDPDVDSEEIERVLSQDPRLTYKLLRIVNSAYYGIQREITSLREAIIYLGLMQIRSWANLIVLSNVEDKPDELLVTTMLRAKMCECLADYIGEENGKSFYTVGLLSTLDALLDQPMQEILETVPLAEILKEALLDRSGLMGQVLDNVIAYEKANWEGFHDLGLEADAYRAAYLESIQWANESTGVI